MTDDFLYRQTGDVGWRTNDKRLFSSQRAVTTGKKVYAVNKINTQSQDKQEVDMTGDRSLTNGMFALLRAWIGRNSPRRGTIDVFAENLPGFVDNIRRTNRGTYWVAFSRARHANLPSVLDTYGTQPAIREHIMQVELFNAQLTFTTFPKEFQVHNTS